jgi:hypothetical protein
MNFILEAQNADELMMKFLVKVIVGDINIMAKESNAQR